MFNETSRGVLTKLGFFSVVAISLFLVSKKHTAIYKERRHKRESDGQIDSEYDEFGFKVHRPGFPLSDESNRALKYQGSGSAYSSRTLGDKFSILSIVYKKWFCDPKKKGSAP